MSDVTETKLVIVKCAHCHFEELLEATLYRNGRGRIGFSFRRNLRHRRNCDLQMLPTKQRPAMPFPVPGHPTDTWVDRETNQLLLDDHGQPQQFLYLQYGVDQSLRSA